MQIFGLRIWAGLTDGRLMANLRVPGKSNFADLNYISIACFKSRELGYDAIK